MGRLGYPGGGTEAHRKGSQSRLRQTAPVDALWWHLDADFPKQLSGNTFQPENPPQRVRSFATMEEVTEIAICCFEKITRASPGRATNPPRT